MSHSIALDSKFSAPRGNWMAWLVCLSAGLFFFYEFFQLNIFDVINQPLREDFAIDATALSWMSSAYLWADLLFLLPAGVILDRYSTRKVILSAMLVCVLGTMGFALTHSFFLASFFHFLSGIGNAFCFLSCIVLVSHWFPPRRQAFVVGLLVTMAFVGGMMAHTPFAYLYELVGWRQALLVDAGVGTVLLIWIGLIIKDRPDEIQIERSNSSPATLSSFMQALTNRQNWFAGLYTSLLNLPIMVLCALWGASYLQVVHGLSDIVASNVVSLIFMGSIVGCPLVGWLSDLHGRRKPLMVLGAIATLMTVAPLFLNGHLSQLTLSVIFFLLGFFTSTQVISYPLIAESNRADNTGSSTGIASLIIMGGGGVAQVLFGWLMTYHANSSSTNYTVADFQFALWMFPVAAVAALMATLLIRETYCRSSRK